MRHTGWTTHPDGSHTAKIGRYQVEIHPARVWQFWRGDHGGVPCQTGPGSSHTIAFEGSHSSMAFTLEGAKAQAEWTVQNNMTGHRPPDSIYPPEELEARALWDATVNHVNATYGES